MFKYCFIFAICKMVSGGGQRMSPAAINHMQTRMKLVSSKSLFKQQQGGISKALLPKYDDVKTVGPPTFPDNVDGFPVIEMYVRQSEIAPWSRYEDINTDKKIHTLISDMYTFGGIHDEVCRTYLQEEFSKQIFGSAFGVDQLVLSKIKSNLPNLLKVKQRIMEFGYKIRNENETYITPIIRQPYVSRKSTVVSSNPYSISLDLQNKLQIRNLDGSEILPTSSSANKFHEWINLKLLPMLTSCGSDNFLLCSDGSALVSGRGTLCVEASGGVTITPISSVDQKAIISQSVSLSIHDIESMAVTPFDAELLPAFALTLIASKIKEQLQPQSPLIKFTMLTDSKAIRKALRSDGPNQFTELEVQADSTTSTSEANIDTPPLSKTEPVNRKTLWKITSLLVRQLETTGSEITIDWINGHPERNEPDQSKWSDKENIIWMTDAIARKSKSSESPSMMPTSNCTALDLLEYYCQQN